MLVPFQTVGAERIRLRTLRHTDAEAVQVYRSTESVAKYQSWDTDFSVKQAHDLVEQSLQNPFGKPGSWTQLGIACLETDRVIGDIGVLISDPTTDLAEIGYSLAPENQGQGIATEALQLLLSLLATQYKVSSVKARTDVRNDPSRRLLVRLGFVEQSLTKQSGFYKGEWVDEMDFTWEATS